MLSEMTTYANNDDYEAAHGYADDILIELINLIIDYSGIYEAEVSEILEQYHKVGKWYA